LTAAAQALATQALPVFFAARPLVLIFAACAWWTARRYAARNRRKTDKTETKPRTPISRAAPIYRASGVQYPRADNGSGG
jgi:hypothetical protein